MRRFVLGLAVAVAMTPLCSKNALGDEPPALSTPPPPIVPPVPTLGTRSPPAAPSPERRFGDPHALVVDGAITGLVRRSDSGGSTAYSAEVVPGFDYFVARNFSAGASLLLAYDHLAASAPFAGQTTWRFGVGGQVGFNLWLSERVSLWPRALLNFEQIRTNTVVPTLPSSGQPVAGGGSTDAGNIVSAEIYAPILFHPARHFFVGFGPEVTTDLYNSVSTVGAATRETVFGVASTVGGWI